MLNESDQKATRHIGEPAEADDHTVPEAATGRNIIIAIGINEYQHQPQLNNPINDAHAVLTLFKQCGFQELPSVPSLVANDATRSAIADLPARLAAELLPDDNLVLFFAGHGEMVERQAPDSAEPGKTYTHRTGYLIPVDGPQSKPGDWIKLDAFLEELSVLPARHIFVILDACKSGIALADKFKVKGGDQPAAIAELQRRPSRRVITSAMHDQKAADSGSGSGHSLFAEALIAAIQDRQADPNGDGFVTTLEIFSFVQDRVSDRAQALGLTQTPDYGWLAGDGSGDLVISLREGAFNRLIQEALDAMLRHDVARLDGLVAQLVAANPTYPKTLYLQFRLKFMQGNIIGASETLHELLGLEYQEGAIPISRNDLRELAYNLNYLMPLLIIPHGAPPVEVKILAGTDVGAMKTAPTEPFPFGVVYQLRNGVAPQFQVRNKSDSQAYLYYVEISPYGLLDLGPFLPRERIVTGLMPGAIEHLDPFRVDETLSGPVEGITEIRVLYSPAFIPVLAYPDRTNTEAFLGTMPQWKGDLVMTSVWYQVLGNPASDFTYS